MTGQARHLRLAQAGAVIDQVPRLETFRQDHPDVTVTYIRPSGVGGYWEATWPLPDDGTRTIINLSLKRLLDKLDRELGGQ